jgi:signal transduction histidine kinase
LTALGVENPEAHAETLVESGLRMEELDEIHSGVDATRFSTLMRWLCNILLSSRVIHEVGEASSRISALVGAIKSHVYMDRARARQPVAVHQGISDTLTILNYKLKTKDIIVERSFAEGLPEISGYGGELNQVWTNLIDNAIDAMDQEGRLQVSTCREGEAIQVTITDNGKGIPSEIMGQIFDPFFTTKRQGEGTGIGLDIVKQIVDHHHGEVRVNSVPGKTQFHVVLPLQPPPRAIDDGPLDESA